MGASSSKPDASTPPHVWKGSGPTSVSQNMIEQLQTSTETDASRAQTLELQIQARVAEELRKLHESETAKLREVQEKLSSAAEEHRQKQLEPAADGSDKDTASNKKEAGPAGREAVAKEVEALRARLEHRRKVRALPESVEAARSEVVRCLREHDRRPLDCWQEVEAFKEEVRRLERSWVDKVVS